MVGRAGRMPRAHHPTSDAGPNGRCVRQQVRGRVEGADPGDRHERQKAGRVPPAVVRGPVAECAAGCP